jgi:hypothetical protein
MIELLYFASQIQCGAGGAFLNIQIDVYHHQELIKTMSVNEKALLPVDSIKDLTFKYTAINNNTRCNLSLPTEMVLAPNDIVPNIPGVYDQTSIQNMLNGLKEYEELFLVELGTTNTKSAAFDLQDVVGIVNNNPAVATIYPD